MMAALPRARGAVWLLALLASSALLPARSFHRDAPPSAVARHRHRHARHRGRVAAAAADASSSLLSSGARASIDVLVERRAAHRRSREFREADALKNRIEALSVSLTDLPNGQSTWTWVDRGAPATTVAAAEDGGDLFDDNDELDGRRLGDGRDDSILDLAKEALAITHAADEGVGAALDGRSVAALDESLRARKRASLASR